MAPSTDIIASALFDLHQVFDRHGIWHALTYGTLLGAVREGDLYAFSLFNDGVLRRFDLAQDPYWCPHSSFPHFFVEQLGHARSTLESRRGRGPSVARVRWAPRRAPLIPAAPCGGVRWPSCSHCINRHP